jgi:hypothetical protein
MRRAKAVVFAVLMELGMVGYFVALYHILKAAGVE